MSNKFHLYLGACIFGGIFLASVVISCIGILSFFYGDPNQTGPILTFVGLVSTIGSYLLFAEIVEDIERENLRLR